MSEAMTADELIVDELRAALPGAVVRAGEPLAKRTTLRAGGVAEVYVEPSSEGDLARVVQICREREVPMMLLGRGSNLLIRDGGIRGVVVCLAHPCFCGIEVYGRQMRCGAGRKIEGGFAARPRGGPGRPGIFGGHSRKRGRRVAHERRRDGQRHFWRGHASPVHG